MKRFTMTFLVGVALLSGCGLEEDEAVLDESAAALELTLNPPIAVRPRISSISPLAAAPGATVTINGAGFDMLIRGPAAFGSPTNTAVRASLTYVSSTQMTAVVPAGAQPGPIYVLSMFGTVLNPMTVQLTSSQTFTPLVVPAAPTNLAARAVSFSQVDLSWTDASWNETGFEVWIRDAAGWRLLRTVAANQTSYVVTLLLGSTNYSFRVRAQNATGPSAYSNTVSVTTPAAIGTVVLTNNAQIGASRVTFNAVAQSATTVVGNQATFSVAPGNYFVEAELTMANGEWVCSLGGNVAVTAGQTSTLRIDPLTAGQVLTHCSGSADYVQGSFVDPAGFHTVEARIHANGTFNWWLDGNLQAALSLTNTSFSDPWLTFVLDGELISMGWPFGSLQVTVDRHPVLMIRDAGW